MRVLRVAAMVGLLVAGCMQADKNLDMRQLNESLRFVLNKICSLACSNFEYRNITPSELYFYLRKELDSYQRISDDMEKFCAFNRIEPCYISVEKRPIELLNILDNFKPAVQPKPELPKIPA